MSESVAYEKLIWKGNSSVLEVRGADALDFLHRLSTQDLRGNLKEPGTSTSTSFVTASGKLVEWCRVYRLASEAFLLLCSSERGDELREWIDRYVIIEDVETKDVTADYVHLEVGAGVTASESFEVEGAYVVGVPSGMGFRCEVLYPVDGPVASQLEALVSGDATARERHRLLTGQPSPEFEYYKGTNPLELNLLHDTIGWNAGCYIGQEIISRMDSYDKVARGLIGLECLESEPPQIDPGTKLVDAEGKSVGKVTSSGRLESGTLIGLAIVGRAYEAGTEVTADPGGVPTRWVLRQRSFGQAV